MIFVQGSWKRNWMLLIDIFTSVKPLLSYFSDLTSAEQIVGARGRNYSKINITRIIPFRGTNVYNMVST